VAILGGFFSETNIAFWMDFIWFHGIWVGFWNHFVDDWWRFGLFFGFELIWNGLNIWEPSHLHSPCIFEWMIRQTSGFSWGYPPSTFGSWWRLDLSRRSTKITKSCPRSWSFTEWTSESVKSVTNRRQISDSAEYQQTLFSIMMHKADFVNHIWYGI
jgi:hypothetical protein